MRLATGAGLKTFSEPFDISQKVSKTWWVTILKHSIPTNVLFIGIYHGLSFSLQHCGLLL